MLTKLMKYDFKALNRYLILIHAFLLAAAAAPRRLAEHNRVNIWNDPVCVDCSGNLLCYRPVDRDSFL